MQNCLMQLFRMKISVKNMILSWTTFYKGILRLREKDSSCYDNKYSRFLSKNEAVFTEIDLDNIEYNVS